MSDSPAIVVLTERGLVTARRIQGVMPGAVIMGFETRVTGADVSFREMAVVLQRCFNEGQGIIAVCATGIVVRALAPVLSDKRREPPVIVVAENGQAVIPLLGGHAGGNKLARRVADCLGVAAALTTASDTRYGIALDDPPAGWVLANPQDHKAFTAKLLESVGCVIAGDAPWLERSALVQDAASELKIHITDLQRSGSETELVYHPQRLAIGVGCERGIEPAELQDLVYGVIEQHGLAKAAIAGLFSLDLKADEVAVQVLAGQLQIQARFFDAPTLEAQTPKLANPSQRVFEEVGCHGVAEAAALAATGADAQLLVAKTKSKRATCAVARAAEPLDISSLGRPQGRLSIVGLGPGKAAWCTPEARSTIDHAEHVVGYQGYLDLAGAVLPHQTTHAFELGQEETRVRKAFSLAAEGCAVALVCSGDPGIYAMASLAYELVDREQLPQWQRVAVHVVPGISAVQGAAARVGAPLGHDFCLISLSDLLTPWPVIENRLQAAAKGDFVLALYNPSSNKRTRQLVRAAEILAEHRPAGTPVIVARNVGRPEESLRVLDLSELRDTRVDMLSLVIIGATNTRRMRLAGTECVYTPRGYLQAPAKEAVA